MMTIDDWPPGAADLSGPRACGAVWLLALLAIPLCAWGPGGSVPPAPDPDPDTQPLDDCPGVANPEAGDTYLAAEGRVFHVDTPGPGDSVCVADLPDLVALTSTRDGTPIALTTAGALYSIDPITTATALIPAPPFSTAIDIAVAATGHVLVLESDGGSGVPTVSQVDPVTGDATLLEPPNAVNYLGIDGAIPTSIAYRPGGGCVVAQLTDLTFSVVTIARDGVQSMLGFIPPGEAPATRLAVDVLSSGLVILATDTGDVIAADLAAGRADHLGNLGDEAGTVDIVATGVQQARAACGPNLYAIDWGPGEADWSVVLLQTFADAVLSVSANRGPVAPGGLLASYGFEDTELFAERFSIHRFGADGMAQITTVGTDGVLALTTGWSAGSVPIAVRTETPIPQTGIEFACDYQFQQGRAQLEVYVNQRFAFSFPAPPAGAPGGPGSESFGHLTREINLDRLGLAAAPRLVVEVRLTGLLGSPGTPAYVTVWLDNLVLGSSTCSSAFGDLTGDSLVNLCDVQELTKDYGSYDTGWACNDLNQDGYVDAFDFDILLQLTDPWYDGCSPPSNPDSCVRAGLEAITEGNLVVVARDADWVNWLYEVRLDGANPAVCERKFRMPGADPADPPVYTQVRHDGHGKLYAVNVGSAGWIESWHNEDVNLIHTLLEIPLPSAIEGLKAMDVAVAHDLGLWGSYAPTGWVFGMPEEIGYHFVHYEDGQVDACTHGLYTRGRTMVAGAPGQVWGLTTQGECGVGYDRFINPVTQKVHVVGAMSATLNADRTRGSDRLYLGGSVNGSSGLEGVVQAYDVSAGMDSVSGPPLWSLSIPGCTAVTGAAEDSAGGLYVCGIRSVQVPGHNWWEIEAHLYRVENYQGGPPQAIDITPQPCAGEFVMPQSMVVFRAAGAGDFDANGQVDLYDFAAFQTCFDQDNPHCLDDFDVAPWPAGDGVVNQADFAEFAGLLGY